ncbi:MAG: DUF998 domain-containing protein [Candidatus Hodarchaeota archaeon]
MVLKTESRMEVVFGLSGALFMAIMLPLTALVTPGYTPLEQTVSSLGEGAAKTLFSIAFVVSGSLLIPFYIYLERELIYIKENIRRLATGVAIFTNMCIALVGIIPPETKLEAFDVFHNFVAITSFSGSALYIVLYSYLMYHVPKSKMYKGPAFKKYLAYYGFFIGIIFIILLIEWILTSIINPLIEWILTIMILIWIIITASQCISYKFFGLPGLYYKKDQYPEALELFEEAIQILDNLGIKHDPIKKTLKENIQFLRSEVEKESNNSDDS